MHKLATYLSNYINVNTVQCTLYTVQFEEILGLNICIQDSLLQHLQADPKQGKKNGKI